MNKKFDPKKYLDRDLVRVEVPNAPSVSRRYVWSKLKARYEEPHRGKIYEARRWNILSRKRETKLFESLEEARHWQQSDFTKPEASSRSDKYTINDLLLDWQKSSWPMLRPTTVIYYSKIIRVFEPLLGVEVEALTPKIIDEWLLEIKSPKWLATYRSTRKSLDKELETLKAMVNWYIEHNDDTKLVSPFKKRHQKALKIRDACVKRSSYMTNSELATWMEELREYSDVFAALAWTQVRQILRVSEVCAMKWSNLDLASRAYRVCEHALWTRQRGDEVKIVPGTKTLKAGDSYTTYLRADVAALLSQIPKHPESDLIFHDEGQPLTYRQVQAAYDRAFVRSKLPYRGTHVLRHTGATEFLEETSDLLALQQMGNWRDAKMAMHYAKITATRARDAIEKAERKAPRLRLIVNE